MILSAIWNETNKIARALRVSVMLFVFFFFFWKNLQVLILFWIAQEK